MNEILKLENVSKQYKQGNAIIEVLKDINFSVKEGEVIAIIGSSGSGKSTLLHLMGLLDQATSGKLYFKGRDIAAISEKEKTAIRLKYIGFVYQYHFLLADFNARDNIAIVHQLLKGSYKESRDEANMWLDVMGLPECRLNLPSELSGGQQQRVAIARALINKPSLILADEPTGNLDPKRAIEIFEMFTSIAKEQKIAVVVVTHNHELAKMADKIYNLENGNIEEVIR
ncbi:MAG: ABC transporter ATP-binding protein [Rickettsiaceae bacterium]|nr:ABC transporter ATP-binding protein [Rickettsiaceae bacterium]